MSPSADGGYGAAESAARGSGDVPSSGSALVPEGQPLVAGAPGPGPATSAVLTGDVLSGSPAGDADDVIYITEELENKVRQNFGRKVMGTTAGMLVLSFAIMAGVKFAGRAKIQSVPYGRGGGGALSAGGRLLLEQYDEMFLTTLAEGHEGNLSDGYVEKVTQEVGGLFTTSVILAVIGVVVGLPTYCAVMCRCCGEKPRQYPYSYLFCLVISAAFGLQLQLTCFLHMVSTILLALGVTAFAVVLLYFLSFFCVDLTGCGLYLFALSMVFTLLIVVLMLLSAFGVLGHMSGLSLGIAAVGAVFSMVYIVYVFQLIIGGKNREHQFSIDDHAYASIILYMEIYHLFVYMLRILGSRGRD
eukprot:g17169.t1